MINKLISKSQVRVLKCEDCQSEDYIKGYVRAISDVLDLETTPTLGADSLEKMRAEIAEIPNKYPMTVDYESGIREALSIIDKYTGGKAE